MIYRTLAIITLVLAAGTAAADGPRGPGGPHGPDFDRLAIILDLDDGQKQEVERIMTEHHDAMRTRHEAMRASGEKPDRDAMMAEREQMQASLRTQLGTVLTENQLEKLDALHEMRGERRPPPHHRKGGYDGPSDQPTN